jgi:nucleoside-diphosphate-sugar epimerase
MKRKKKILLTGGNSQIGQDLVRFFLKKYIVISTYRNKKIPFKHKNLKQIKYNFNKNIKVSKNIDYFIHLAAMTPINAKVSKKMLIVNKLGIEKILMQNINFRSIVLISTLSVYGKINKKIINENQKPYKIDYYGKSKILIENQIKKYSKKINSNFLILRLPGVIGNFQNKHTFLNKVLNNLYNNKDLFYKNPNSLTNNVIHTDTLARIINSFFYNNKPKNKILNLCSKKKEKLKDIIEFIKNKFKSDSKIKEVYTKKDNSFYISTKRLIANKIKIINTKKTILKTIKFYQKLK